MNREPTLPPSTTTTRRPRPTTIILRLRSREPARPPPQAASTPSSGATSPLESAGVAPATTSDTADPLVSAADVEGEEPHPSTTQSSTTSRFFEGDGSNSTASPVFLDDAANGVDRAFVLGSPDLWGDLFLPDLVRQVASCLRFSRKDVERMRAVCSAWREAIPSTIDPILVLSKKKPEVDSEVILMQIKRSNRPEDARFNIKLPSTPPPSGVSCWGSALGLMALQHSPNRREILVYCVQCGESKDMLPLPMGMIPKAMYLEPLTPQRFVLMAEERNANGSLYVDSDGFPWPMEGGPWWLQAPGFGNIPLRSMALVPGVVRAGADKDSIIIIDESGRPIDDEAEIMHIQLPPLFLSDGTITSPWEKNGQHLFVCSMKIYLVQIFDSPQAPKQVSVRLFGVQKVDEEYTVTPVSDIGKFSVYLGPNQSVVLPSVDSQVGRLPNTIYVEDYRGSIRRPQALAINIQSLSTVVIPFPDEIASRVKDTLPAVWVGLPQQHDLFNHCRDGNCWSFWD